jgi:hypothetical protein
VWIDPAGIENFTNSDQHCGGYLDDDYQPRGYIAADGMPDGPDKGKGFLCPRGSLCIEGDENPEEGTMSFDTILNSLELVFTIMSNNGWSDVLYAVADAEYLVSALFFVAGMLILSLWLMSLLIAVITSSFQIIREESRTSAFSGHEIREDDAEHEEKNRVSNLKRLYDKTSNVWVVVIAYGLVSQALRSAKMSDFRRSFIDTSETIVTFILFAEILVRLVVDFRHFFRSKQNITDLLIAIITMIIQLPVIKQAHDGKAYAWLTIFQILRAYRVVLAVPVTRDLIVSISRVSPRFVLLILPQMVVCRNVSGLLNLIVFVFLLTFLASIFASQLFRGQIPAEDDGETVRMAFFDIYNSFLGMYQILSSEDWTTVLFSVTSNEKEYGIAWIGASFCILWFIFGNCKPCLFSQLKEVRTNSTPVIVLNMFIAVIQENFDVSEDEKRLEQVKAFLQKKEDGLNASYG